MKGWPLIGLCLAIVGCGGSGFEAPLGLMAGNGPNGGKSPLKGDIGFKKAMGKVLADGLTKEYTKPTVAESERAKLIGEGKAPLVFIKGDPKQKLIALTFDDSPYAKWTPKLLDVLRLLNVKATFFCIGASVKKFPAIARQIVEDGHEIGNHSYNHIDLAWLSRGEAQSEIEACNDAIRKAVGIQPTLVRPPGGNFDEYLVEAAKKTGMTLVFWTANVGDYRRPTPIEVLKVAEERTGPGGIVLLHDGVQQTLAALPTFVHHMRQKGYKFVTVSELMAAKKAPDDSKILSYATLGLKKPVR